MSIVQRTNGFCLCLMRNRKSPANPYMLGNCNRSCAPKIDKDCEGIRDNFRFSWRRRESWGGRKNEVKTDREIVFKTIQFRDNDLRFNYRESIALQKKETMADALIWDGIYFAG
ncbi:hypothetical protein CEXT_640731 [Caerostris extrusa]|uniref:Uncharacterized protein n=1 Tax=Caerostris extrusa TaxID=172846 RepID=A0AAV4MW55_CAEEX|nr:hypothetical protein CEXT_640731 [Caerostris extrusa]